MAMASKSITARIESGNIGGAYDFANRFQSKELLYVVAEAGDRDAAFELARRHDETKLIQQLARQGDKEAGLELAREHDDPGPLQELAAQGDDEAGAILASHFFAMADRSQRQAERWKWLCMAAHSGHQRAQHLMAARYYAGMPQPVTKDVIRAYVWYSLAASNGDEAAEAARQTLARRMPSNQLQEARQMYSAWQADYDDCDEGSQGT